MQFSGIVTWSNLVNYTAITLSQFNLKQVHMINKPTTAYHFKYQRYFRLQFIE